MVPAEERRGIWRKKKKKTNLCSVCTRHQTSRWDRTFSPWLYPDSWLKSTEIYNIRFWLKYFPKQSEQGSSYWRVTVIYSERCWFEESRKYSQPSPSFHKPQITTWIWKGQSSGNFLLNLRLYRCDFFSSMYLSAKVLVHLSLENLCPLVCWILPEWGTFTSIRFLRKELSHLSPSKFIVCCEREWGAPVQLTDYLRHTTASFLKVTIISAPFHARIFPHSSYFVSHVLNFKGGNATVPANCETTVWLIILAFLCPSPVFLRFCRRKTWRIILKWWHLNQKINCIHTWQNLA